MSFGGTGKSTTLGVGEILRVSGVKGGENPTVSGGIQPVMLVADFSRSYTAEPFEGRAFASFFGTIIPNNNRGVARFFSRGPGGAVVEDLLYSCTTTGGLIWLDIVTAPPAFAYTDLPQLQIGGRATLSQVQIAGAPAAFVPTGIGPFSFFPTSFFGVSGPTVNSRLYVPPGSSLLIVTDGVSNGGQSHSLWLSYRDIPAPLGNP